MQKLWQKNLAACASRVLSEQVHVSDKLTMEAMEAHWSPLISSPPSRDVDSTVNPKFSQVSELLCSTSLEEVKGCYCRLDSVAGPNEVTTREFRKIPPYLARSV